MATNRSSTVDDVTAIRGVPQRITAAWAENDADAFAQVFAEDATLVMPNNIYLSSRDEIRAFMAAGFAGPYKGTKVFGEPLSLRRLGADAAVIVTRGGVLAPGETAVAPERAIRATWVLSKKGGEWFLAAYQNTPVGTA